MQFTTKCVFFICAGKHKSEEHNSKSENNYSEKHRRLLKPPGSRGLRQPQTMLQENQLISRKP